MDVIIERLYLEEEFELVKKNYNLCIFFLFIYYYTVSMIKTYMNRFLYNEYLKNIKKDKMDPPHPNNIHTDLNHTDSCCHYMVYEFLKDKTNQIVYCNKCHTTF